MADESANGAYYAVITAPVMCDSHLRPRSKLLYGIISFLSYQTGFCYYDGRICCLQLWICTGKHLSKRIFVHLRNLTASKRRWRDGTVYHQPQGWKREKSVYDCRLHVFIFIRNAIPPFGRYMEHDRPVLVYRSLCKQ